MEFPLIDPNQPIDNAAFNDFFWYFSQEFIDFLLFLLNILLEMIKTVISVPATRRVVSPLFYYFGVFDDIYFYQFQDRRYGDTMTAVFSELDDIQAKKWSIVSYERVAALFGDSAASLNDTLDYQGVYLTYNFTAVDHTFLGTESLLGNCQNFAFVGLPMIIVGFVLLRFAFRLLFAYPVSRLLRKFDFWLFALLLLFDGNVQ